MVRVAQFLVVLHSLTRQALALLRGEVRVFETEEDVLALLELILASFLASPFPLHILLALFLIGNLFGLHLLPCTVLKVASVVGGCFCSHALENGLGSLLVVDAPPLEGC